MKLRDDIVLTREWLDNFNLEHERTSCSDTVVVNGGRYKDRPVPKCLRCYLLEEIDMGRPVTLGELPLTFEINAHTKTVPVTYVKHVPVGFEE